MPETTLTVGDVLPFATLVESSPGVPANAGAMTLAVTLPDGTAAAGSPFTVTPGNVGEYDRNITSTLAGRYPGYWLATGVNSGAHTQVFVVQPGADTALMSLAAARKHLNYNDPANTTDDDEIQGWLAAVTTVIEHEIGPVCIRSVVDERHDNGPSLWLRKPPVIAPFTGTVTPWLTTGTTYAAADLRVSPESGRLERKDGLLFTGGPFAVSYPVGRQVVTQSICKAAQVILKGFWETQRGASGLPLQSADELINLPGMGLVMQHAEVLLRPFRKLPGIA